MKTLPSPSVENYPAPLVTSGLFPLLLKELKHMYWAEARILRLLPELEALLSAPQLCNALRQYAADIRRHLRLLRKVFTLCSAHPKSERSVVISLIMNEIQEEAGHTVKKSVTRDVVLIISLQKILNFQLTAYRGLSTMAAHMPLQDVSILLDEIREEVRAFHSIVSEVVLSGLYLKAV